MAAPHQTSGMEEGIGSLDPCGIRIIRRCGVGVHHPEKMSCPVDDRNDIRIDRKEGGKTFHNVENVTMDENPALWRDCGRKKDLEGPVFVRVKKPTNGRRKGDASLAIIMVIDVLTALRIIELRDFRIGDRVGRGLIPIVDA